MKNFRYRKFESGESRILGKWRDNTTLLQMRDIKGNPRIKLMLSPLRL